MLTRFVDKPFLGSQPDKRGVDKAAVQGQDLARLDERGDQWSGR